MKILVTAKYVSGNSREGGSGRFIRCVIDVLESMGHEVIATAEPEKHVKDKFDLIICSHHLKKVRDNPAKKICISHGLINDEHFEAGADRYISISEEIRDDNLSRGFLSEVIPQPIHIPIQKYPQVRLENILIIRREPVKHDPFEFLRKIYNVTYSDLDIPIEKQIERADLCITLGRGALEAMSYGRPVLIADNRHYIGNYGDGYVLPSNIHEIAKNNFSGRRYKYTCTKDWILEEISKYKQMHSLYLYEYVKEYYDSGKIVRQYLKENDDFKMGFGVLVNDLTRLDMVLRQSGIDGNFYFVKNPTSATSGLNKLLKIMRDEKYDIAVLTHQDMYYRQGWTEALKEQINKLPDNWMIAGIIGKDFKGNICGRLHDMRMPIHFNSFHIFPAEACCFDECCIIVNLKSKFEFDERLKGFDLYGTLCVLQVQKMGGTAWVLDAFAEHYCMRPFPWLPGKDFIENLKWLNKEFPNARRIDSTVLGIYDNKQLINA